MGLPQIPVFKSNLQAHFLHLSPALREKLLGGKCNLTQFHRGSTVVPPKEQGHFLHCGGWGPPGEMPFWIFWAFGARLVDALVQVGTPSQRFELVADTGAIFLWLSHIVADFWSIPWRSAVYQLEKWLLYWCELTDYNALAIAVWKSGSNTLIVQSCVCQAWHGQILVKTPADWWL